MPAFLDRDEGHSYALFRVVTGFLFIRHGTQALFPSNNGSELVALYCSAFLYIAARAAGPFSVDSAR